MKTMNYIKIGIASSILSIAAGCTSFLEEDLKSSLAPDNTYTSSLGFEVGATGLYAIARSEYNTWGENGAFMHNGACAYEVLQISTDLCRMGTVRDGSLVPFAEMTLNPSTLFVGSYWNWAYNLIASANELLIYSEKNNNWDYPTDKQLYQAEARFFRAYAYRTLVYLYGDVPWVDRPIDAGDPLLFEKGRDPREMVMQKVIEDLDFAVTNLPVERSVYRVTRWAALALKSRVCLFEGTFRKYHGLKDWESYLTACATASKRFIDESGYSVYTTGTTPYLNLFSSLKALDTEIVLARAYNTAIGLKHDVNGYLTSITMGRPGLLKNIANMYLMKDGTPFTSQPGWETMQLPEESKNRDGRFAQTVRTPGYKRIDDTALSAPNLAATMTGYQLVKYLQSAKYDSYNASTNDLPLLRAAEVMLNYAEAKAELGTLTQEDIDLAIKPLRDRAGVANLSLTKANASPDPYLASPETGYANVTGDNKGVILEIRRERTVELLMENLRYWDIMRWKEGKRFEKPFTGLYFPGTGSYDLNNDGVDDVCIWSGSKPATSAPAVYELNKEIFLSGGDSGYIIIHTDYARSWNEERDYLFEYALEDLKGNVRVCRFTVRGERDDARLAEAEEREQLRRASGAWLEYDRPQVVQRPGMELRIPAGALTKDEVLRLRVEAKEDGISNLYVLHDEFVPLVKRATLMLSPRMPVSRPEKCYIESSRGYVGGEYADGWFSARIRDLGESYALAVDTVVPVVRWKTAFNGKKVSVLRCVPTDSGSGVKSFKAYVDGRFVLFTSYRGVWTCRLKETPLRPEGKRRRLTVKVTDRCGNETVDEKEFIY